MIQSELRLVIRVGDISKKLVATIDIKKRYFLLKEKVIFDPFLVKVR